MKQLRKALCLCLALLMLITVLVSCKKDGGADQQGGADTAAAAGTAGGVGGGKNSDVAPLGTDENGIAWETDEKGYVLDNIKDVNLENREIKILTGSDRMSECYASSDELSNQLSNAVFMRNQSVEIRTRCKLTFVREPDGWDYRSSYSSKAMSLATTGDVDMFAVYSLTANNLMVNGLLVDLASNDRIELEKPWWNSKMVNGCTLYDRLYFCSGDISYQLVAASYTVYFNKDLLASMEQDMTEEYGTADLYEIVENGDWTLEKMINLSKAVTSDTDGIKNQADTVGFVSQTTFLDAFWAGSNLRHLETAADGSIVVSEDMGTQKATDLCDTLIDFMKTPSAVINGGNLGVAADGTSYDAFWSAGQSLFAMGTVASATVENSFEYGFVPVPKYDDEQAEYLTCPSFTFGMWGVCRTATDHDGLYAVLECMASESYRATMPMYFETILLGRQDSVNEYNMLLKIKDSVVVDGGRVMDNIFNTNTWSIFRGTMMTGTDYSTYYGGLAVAMSEQAASLNALVLNMERLYS